MSSYLKIEIVPSNVAEKDKALYARWFKIDNRDNTIATRDVVYESNL